MRSSARRIGGVGEVHLPRLHDQAKRLTRSGRL
jgi:hypothetical protein